MKNRAQFTIGSAILIIVIIIIIAVMMWFLLLPPSCGESDKDNTFWDVRLGNNTYIFQYFDKSYMERLVGFNVTITVCRIGKHFNFISSYICEEVD